MQINLRKGLKIPLAGEPQQEVGDGNAIGKVALLGRDYIGLRPRMVVAVGDRVAQGQTLFEDKKNPGVKFTSPAGGFISVINRGAKRKLQSVVVEVDGDDEVTFSSFQKSELPNLERTAVCENLIQSGLWTAFRTRPFSKVPPVDAVPHAIFVTAIDTNPLAADPNIVLREHQEDFVSGLTVLRRLTEGSVYVCKAPQTELSPVDDVQIKQVEVRGPHPAGLVGTHIHFLDPVDERKSVWHINYQDVIAVGKLFTTGRLWVQRIISLAGSRAGNPRLLRTRLGASTEELVAQETLPGKSRIISGPVLSGFRAFDAFSFLGRYHLQVGILPDGQEREFLNWAMPGASKFSAVRAFAGHLFRRRTFNLSTSQNGSPRAMVPIGNFEGVMPLDILPAPLLKALIVRDTDSAQALGCLELDEEDLALCSFVCSGKYEYGAELRDCLQRIEKMG